MLTRPQLQRTRLRQLSDGLLCALAVALAYALRAQFPWLDLPDLEKFSDYIWLLLLSGLLGPVLLTQQGLYDPAQLTTRVATIFQIMRGCTYTVLALVLFLFIVRVQYARSVIIFGGMLAAFLVYGRHELTQSIASRRAQTGELLRRRVLWVGRPALLARLRQALSPTERALIDTVAETDAGHPDKITDLLHRHAVNVVILHLGELPAATVAAVFQACEREGVEIIIQPGLGFASPFRLAVDQLAGEPVIYYRAQSARPVDPAVKQAVDYLGAVVLLVVCAPLFLLSALLVRLSSPGPVIFRQERAGLNGRPFVMYKFRSMRAGAENERAELAAHNEMSGPVFKMRDDPRTTAVGRFLRRHSLDELPQLWNVLRGEMSLVGPRPLPLDEVGRFADPAQRRRLSVRPGLTCLWQIRGRNNISSFEEWVRLDLEYIDQWSLWLDLKILFATVPVAILGRGGR